MRWPRRGAVLRVGATRGCSVSACSDRGDESGRVERCADCSLRRVVILLRGAPPAAAFAPFPAPCANPSHVPCRPVDLGVLGVRAVPVRRVTQSLIWRRAQRAISPSSGAWVLWGWGWDGSRGCLPCWVAMQLGVALVCRCGGPGSPPLLHTRPLHCPMLMLWPMCPPRGSGVLGV